MSFKQEVKGTNMTGVAIMSGFTLGENLYWGCTFALAALALAFSSDALDILAIPSDAPEPSPLSLSSATGAVYFPPIKTQAFPLEISLHLLIIVRLLGPV